MSKSQAEALLAQGARACKQGDFSSGIELIGQAITLQPGNWRYHYLLGAMYEESGELSNAITSTQRAAEIQADEPNIWFALGELFLKAGNMTDARRAYQKTLTHKADHIQAQEALWSLNRKQVKAWHFSMMNDTSRNLAYEHAIKAVVKDKTVLEIGVGSGLLSMMAARAGAKHVYACEMVPVIAEKAREIIHANGLSDRITVIPKLSFDVQINACELPHKADVLITETFDPNLIGENVLAIVADAKARLLNPGAAIVPARASLMAVLVESRELYEQTAVDEVSGFDLSAFNEFKVQPGIVVTANNYHFTALSSAVPVVAYHFAEDELIGKDLRFEIPVSKSGTCHAIMSWIRLDMGDGGVYEVSPLDSSVKPKLHWLHALHTWDEAREVEAGTRFVVHARYNPKQFIFS